jgi:hypothetical protein
LLVERCRWRFRFGSIGQLLLEGKAVTRDFATRIVDGVFRIAGYTMDSMRHLPVKWTLNS